jgi:hypothetical protein
MIIVPFAVDSLHPLRKYIAPPPRWLPLPRLSRDVNELRTWRMDIREILSANSLQDFLAEAERA